MCTDSLSLIIKRGHNMKTRINQVHAILIIKTVEQEKAFTWEYMQKEGGCLSLKIKPTLHNSTKHKHISSTHHIQDQTNASYPTKLSWNNFS